MNMQAMLAQAQKMQRDMQKAQKTLEETLFELESAGGAIKISYYGNRKIEKIDIDKDAIDPDDKEMLEDMIKIAVNEAMEKVSEAEAAIQKKFTQGMRMPF
jgi:DNA-binding YbaB/EbfC family protein